MSNPYRKEIHGVSVDLYDIMDAYGVADYARCHAIKKLVCAGQRNGGKSYLQDLQEAKWTIERAIEIEEGKQAAVAAELVVVGEIEVRMGDTMPEAGWPCVDYEADWSRFGFPEIEDCKRYPTRGAWARAYLEDGGQ